MTNCVCIHCTVKILWAPIHLEGKPKDSEFLKNEFRRYSPRVKRCRKLACSCYKTEVPNLPHTDGRTLEYKDSCNSKIYSRFGLVSLRECFTIGLNINCGITMRLCLLIRSQVRVHISGQASKRNMKKKYFFGDFLSADF